MIQALDSFFSFLGEMSAWEFLLYFWPFFAIDFVRYTLLDGIGVLRYLYKRGGRRGNRGARKEARRQLYREYPLVTVIIPGRNEGANLKPLIDSLHQQTYAHLEIIVVDDGSEDRTPEIGRRMEKDGQIDRFLRQRVRGGKASAANTGLRWAEGKFIVHVDADSYLREDAIEKSLIPFYMKEEVGAVGGDLRAANASENLTTRVQAFEYLKTITLGRTASSEYGILRIVAGAFGTFRTDTLRRLGGWDVGPGLDGDLVLKLRKLGLKILHVPESVCYTNLPTDLTSLAKQRYRWSRSLVRFRMRKHSNLLAPRSPFRWTDLITVVDNLLFMVVLDIKWIIYAIQIIITSSGLIPYILVVNVILYSVNNLINYLLFKSVLLTSGTQEPHRGLVFMTPIMPWYFGFYLRAIRSLGYIMEVLFQASYWDPWTPWKVSKEAIKEGV
jgi:cellulose synthase/poly-beta-1,6-N-acetylglucosamine synthase-like glycosyltransferase